MSKTKLLIENFLIFGIGNIISKIIPFIMLPIITRLIPNSYYIGINDMITLTVSFGVTLGVMGMYDSMFRLFFEREDIYYKKEVCATSLINVIFSALTILFVLILFKDGFAKLILNDKNLEFLIIIASIDIFVGILKSIVMAPTRMENKRKTFLIANTIFPILSYSISIPLLIKKHFLIALPLASTLSSATMLIVFAKQNNKWFEIKKYNKNIAKELFKLGLPIMPTFIIYWIFSSFDRIMISNMLGNAEVGIYAIGSKVASISQFIYMAFSGGWSYFAFSTMKEKNQINILSRVFEYLAIISFFLFMILTPLSKIIFSVLFQGDYIRGYEVFPYLFLSPLMLMLFQVVGTQFLIIKKSYYTTLVLILGAVINIILNYILIPIEGIKGAAVSTLIGYTLSNVITVIVLLKLNLIRLDKKIIYLQIFIMVMCYLSFNEINIAIMLLWGLISGITCTILYRDYLIEIINKCKKLIRKNKERNNKLQ